MSADVFGYLGGFLASLIWLPQLVTAMRRRSDPHRLAGVSLGMWIAQGTANGLWLTYGLRTMAWPQIVGNSVALSGATTMVVLLRRDRTQSIRYVAAGTVGVWTVGALVAPLATGFMGAACTGLSRLAQIVSSLRRRTDRSGVAMGTWVLSLTAMGCWLTYGLMASDAPVIVVNVAGLAMNMTVIGIELWTRRDNPPITRRLTTGDSTPDNRVHVTSDLLPPGPATVPVTTHSSPLPRR